MTETERLKQENDALREELERLKVASSTAVETRLKALLEDRDRSLEILETVNEVGRRLTAELDLEKLVQLVTDAATRLCGAQFGAFFYNVRSDAGESMTLYTISGVPREMFSRFPMPRNTEVFRPTFVGEGTLRSDNIRLDPRYGKNSPYHGMPEGHLPVTSYLAVPVTSRTGEGLGGLFFGHEQEGVFSEQSAKIVEGLAAQTAVAMDNARLYRTLQESVKARDEFLSIASHELKTPLTSLKLQSQIRKRALEQSRTDYFTPERLRSMLDADIRQVERLSTLIDDMLDIARINTGKLNLRAERFDLCEVAQELLDQYRPQLEREGAQVSLVCCQPVHGDWDRFRIEQVLANLLTNAARYGSGKPVQVSVEREGEWAVLSVRDQGIGISPKNHERIFQRFERAIDANEVSGLGLGLYICRHIVEMHHGSIEVASEVAQGSTFTVRLPLGS